ncbi:YdaU family protein [Alishewanella sp. SMS9]|nr:YdaU family protein [Alishewanella sp. SMS9]
MNYYKRHIGDYHKKAGRLSMLQHGAYTLLLDACYDREKFPTRDEAIDWCWASSQDEIAAVDFVLFKFFTLEDGRYVQSTISETVAQYQENALKNKQIAIEREQARKLKREQSVHESARSVHEAPPNHKPLTTNHKPIEDQKSIVDSEESPVVQKDCLQTEFDRFWRNYPTKKAKQSAQKAFVKLLNGKTPGKVKFNVDMILSYHTECIEREEIGADKLHAATLLNQKRWEDNPDFIEEFKQEWLKENANG